MSIGERIREIRKEQGLSIDDLAYKLGKNRTTIYRYENGDIENLPLGILDSLANALNTSPAHLMGWDSQLNEYIECDTVKSTEIKHVSQWINEIGEYMLNDEEYEKIIQYAKFLLSIRDK